MEDVKLLLASAFADLDIVVRGTQGCPLAGSRRRPAPRYSPPALPGGGCGRPTARHQPGAAAVTNSGGLNDFPALSATATCWLLPATAAKRAIWISGLSRSAGAIPFA